MKKKIPMGRLEKLVILVMVVTLAVSILPQLDIQQLFAEDPATVTLELKEGSTTRPLSVSTTDTKAVEAILLKMVRRWNARYCIRIHRHSSISFKTGRM